jgi:cell division protein FtsB
MRFGRERLYVLGITVLLLGLGLMASGPYADYTAAQGRLTALEDREAELDESVESLQAEAARLQDPASLEEQARSQFGLVRPGEIPYIVVNPPSDPVSPVNANPVPIAPVDGDVSVVDRLREWFLALGNR